MLIDQDINTALRLEWSVVCALACKAMIMGLDFEQVVNLALERRLKELK